MSKDEGEDGRWDERADEKTAADERRKSMSVESNKISIAVDDTLWLRTTQLGTLCFIHQACGFLAVGR